MSSGTWRGTVGVVKPTYGSGSLVEFIRLLPEGVGCIPMYAGIREHSEQGYLGALETYNAKVAELAEIGVDLIHPEGGPPFMVRGHKAEQEIVAGWEEKYKIPIFTSGISQAEALRALGIKKFPNAQGIYLLGSGAWQVKDIVAVENDLEVPVVHPVAARVWLVQKKLQVRNPIRGASRLLEELP